MLDLTSLKDALSSMNNALSVYQEKGSAWIEQDNVREVIEAGIIQNFEFTYELSWKFIVRWISMNISPDAASPMTKRDIFRTAARIGLIQDPNLWFRFTDARNITSHTYDRKKAEQVLSLAPSLFEEASDLYLVLEKRNDQP
jgi:nucleotidyltransferase substrate binding protein (TIGR01987 family)